MKQKRKVDFAMKLVLRDGRQARCIGETRSGLHRVEAEGGFGPFDARQTMQHIYYADDYGRTRPDGQESPWDCFNSEAA